MNKIRKLRSAISLGIVFFSCCLGSLVAAQALPEDTNATHKLLDIEFEGLRRVDRELLLAQLPFKIDDELTPESLQEEAPKALQTLWNSRFFRDIELVKEVTPAGLKLIFKVQEKPYIKDVQFIGYDALSEEDLKGAINLKPYTILNTDQIERNLQKLKELYLDKGYHLVEITYQLQPTDTKDSAVNIIFTIQENIKVTLKQIQFLGNQQLSSETLKGVMQSREGNEISWLTGSGTYKEEFLQNDIFRLQALYLDEGFITAKIQEPVVNISQDKRYIYVTISIEEGERYQLGEISFAGDYILKDENRQIVIDEALLQKHLHLVKGENFNRTKLFNELQDLGDLYRDQGYAYANITPNTAINAATKTVDLQLEVDLGEMIYFERIEIVGNLHTRDKVIRRELRIFEGEKYNASSLNLSKARVYQLGFFENVNIQTSKGSESNKMKVIVEVKERSTGNFNLGIGVSSTESIIGNAQIAQNNFLGRGQSLSLLLQLSGGVYARKIAMFQFFEPYFLDTNWSLSLNLFATKRYLLSYIYSTTGFSPTFGYLLTHDLRLSFGYNFEYIQMDLTTLENGATNVYPALYNAHRQGRKSSVSSSLVYDKRDNRMFPTRGVYGVLSSEFAATLLGSDEDLAYKKVEFDLRYYYPLPLSLIFKFNTSIGYVFDGGPHGAPLVARYMPGGIFTMRGFTLRSLGPSIYAANQYNPFGPTENVTLGGNKQLIINSEIEIPLIKQAGIKGLLFVDAGNAFNEDEQFFYLNRSSSQKPKGYLIGSNKEISLPLGLYYSCGFGFRWLSPMGLLRFEWGIPLTKRQISDRDLIFEFTIANTF